MELDLLIVLSTPVVMFSCMVKNLKLCHVFSFSAEIYQFSVIADLVLKTVGISVVLQRLALSMKCFRSSCICVRYTVV